MPSSFVQRRSGYSRSVRGLAVVMSIAGALVWSTVTTPAASGLPSTFKIATWNVRSGMGVAGFGTRHWDHTTLNCTDRSKPMNAWGMGLPQKQLETIRADASIVAIAVQEAWNCGRPAQLNSVLGFKTATREQNGVALIARYGFAAQATFHRVGARYDSWLVGGAVCLDVECSTSLPLYSTHWGGSDEEWPAQAQNVLAFLQQHTGPHVFMGDLNIFKIDQWNPRVPCTNADKAGRSRAISLIEQAGYVDTWKATQTGAGFTGMSSRKGCGSPEGNLFKRIDYIYVKRARVVGTRLFARAAPGADAPSDHAGLIAEIALSPASTR
jgi:endonuclease/exonuclease/phosphatase family metal-dependent hydrolase